MKSRWLATLATAAFGIMAVRLAAQGRTRTVQEELGYPASARLLVIHADDLGMAHSVDRATFEALEKGWITSSSILVPCPWFPEVVRFAREHPDADLGVHLAVNSEWTGYRWRPVAAVDAVSSLLDADGYLPLEETAVVAHAKPAEVERELRAQVDRARAAGIRLSHLDSHMATLFRSPQLLDVYLRLGPAYDLPLLLERSGADRSAWAANTSVKALVDRVISLDAPGAAAAEWPAAYEKLLAPLPPGVYELIVHLAYDDDEMRGATWDHPNWGAAWRQADFDLVRSPRFRDFLRNQGFTLVKWKDLARARTTSSDR
jgi:chitin disaccharide deacetylase